MNYTLITYTIKPELEAENAALLTTVFGELAAARPSGFRYAVFQGVESGEFVHLYIDEGAGSDVEALPSFQAYVTGVKDRHSSPAVVTHLKLIGDYRILGTPGDSGP
jgi:hypothetical protein